MKSNLATKNQVRYVHFLIHHLSSANPDFSYSALHLFIDYKFQLTKPTNSFYKNIPASDIQPIIRYLKSGKIFVDIKKSNANPGQIKRIKDKIAENDTSYSLSTRLKKAFRLPAITTAYVHANQVSKILDFINDYTKKQILASYVTGQ